MNRAPPVKLNFPPKPTKPTRQLHWTKIQWGTWNETIWPEVVKIPITIDLQEIENTFAAKKSATEMKAAGKPEQKTATVKKDVVKLVNPKRAYAIDIGLARLRMSNESIRDAIIQMNSNVLNADNLPQVMMLMPSIQELEVVCNYVNSNGPDTGNVMEHSADFFYSLSTIIGTPDLPSRLELFLFQLQFDTTIAAIEKYLNLIADAAKELRTNEELKVLFKLILTIGNFLNAGSPKGEAYGFRLSTLSQLKSTKSTDNALTLMQYLIEIIHKRYPKVRELAISLAKVADASKIESAYMAQEVQKIKVSLDRIQEGIKVVRARATPSSGDQFAVVMTKFCAAATPRYQQVFRGLEKTTRDCEALAIIFGEEAGNLRWEQLFDIFGQFLVDYTHAEQQMNKTQETEKKNSSLQATAASALKKKKPSKKKKQKAVSSMMTNVIGKMNSQRKEPGKEVQSSSKLDAVVDFAAADGRTMRRHPDCKKCPCKNFMVHRSPEIKHCANCNHVH